LNAGQTAGSAIFDTNDKFDDLTQVPGGNAQIVLNSGAAPVWKEFVGTFNSGSLTQLTLRMFTSAQFVGTMYFDNVSVRVAPAPGNAVPHDPASWTLSGSNDGTIWTTVDSRTGVSFTGRGQKQEFSALSNATAYEYYRLAMSNNGGTMLQVAEIELWCEDSVVVNPYQDWKIIHAVSDDNADEDNDGISNILEYALGGDPRSSVSGQRPLVSKNGNTFNFKFHRAEADVTYIIQKSTNLLDWTDYMTVSDSQGAVGSDATVSIPNSEMINGKLFLRLKVEN
jgi:hypothetical protein